MSSHIPTWYLLVVATLRCIDPIKLKKPLLNRNKQNSNSRSYLSTTNNLEADQKNECGYQLNSRSTVPIPAPFQVT
jgi:hypothetical protein